MVFTIFKSHLARRKNGGFIELYEGYGCIVWFYKGNGDILSVDGIVKAFLSCCHVFSIGKREGCLLIRKDAQKGEKGFVYTSKILKRFYFKKLSVY